MKKTYLTLGLLLTLFSIKAQNIEVKAVSQKFSSGVQNAFSIDILANSKDDVERAWETRLKEYKNISIKDINGELFADNLVFNEWGNNTSDVFSIFEENKNDKIVKMNVGVDLGGAYLKSVDQKSKAVILQKIITDFAIKQTKEFLTDRLKSNEDLVKKSTDNQKDLEKTIKNNEADIVGYKKDIETISAKIKAVDSLIVQNDENLKKKIIEINSYKKIVEDTQKVINNLK